jgi:hypothetical protein
MQISQRPLDPFGIGHFPQSAKDRQSRFIMLACLLQLVGGQVKIPVGRKQLGLGVWLLSAAPLRRAHWKENTAFLP